MPLLARIELPTGEFILGGGCVGLVGRVVVGWLMQRPSFREAGALHQAELRRQKAYAAARQ